MHTGGHLHLGRGLALAKGLFGETLARWTVDANLQPNRLRLVRASDDAEASGRSGDFVRLNQAGVDVCGGRQRFRSAVCAPVERRTDAIEGERIRAGARSKTVGDQ